MLTASNSAYQKSADDAAVALLRGAAAKSSAASAKTNADAGDVNSANRGPAVQKNLSASAQAMSLLQNSLNALRPALDGDVATALSDQLEKTRDALTKLDDARQGMIGDRKAAAEQKLELARQKLALLRMMGGDPKAIMRQAKAIAQEIKGAANEYSEALKAQGGEGASNAAVPSDAVTGSADPAATASDATSTTGEAPAVASPADATAKTAAPEVAAQPQSPADKATAEAKDNQHEHDVLEAFKDAARAVKHLMEEAARKLKAQHPADPEADGAAQTGAAVDKAVGELAENIQISQSGGADAALATVMVAATPTIDVQA
ncbi:hypothetical protein [Rhodopseudomonas sp. RCAM05734]|uniref:hypothetical protein n=1 Tax=Rhodopseudomonas sp. RCAM05734 TaxID=3457549 RepID=UPI0040450601